jgi:hypothetical protein
MVGTKKKKMECVVVSSSPSGGFSIIISLEKKKNNSTWCVVLNQHVVPLFFLLPPKQQQSRKTLCTAVGPGKTWGIETRSVFMDDHFTTTKKNDYQDGKEEKEKDFFPSYLTYAYTHTRPFKKILAVDIYVC